MDLLTSATSNLMTTAQTTEASNNAAYRMAIYTFDINFNTYQTLTSTLSMAEASAAKISMLEVYANNILTCPGRSPCTQSDNPADVDTNYDNAMSNINSTMPAPGNGTNAKGDTPQEVLFFVTDGVEDENVSGSRQQSLMDNGWCTKIKNRGIRIAVLYTQYLPLTTNYWYNTYIAPFQSQISSNMQSCASPGLFFQVDVDGDISAAMSALFQSAVKTAYLTQ